MKGQSIQDEQLAQLISECAQRKQTALEHIHQTLGNTLFALTQQMLGVTTLAETALHNGFGAIWQKADSFNKQTQRSSAWITHCVREQALLLHNATILNNLDAATTSEPSTANDDKELTAEHYNSVIEHSLLPEEYKALAPEVLSLLEQLYLKASSYEQLGANTNTDAQTARHSARIGLGQLDTEANFDSPDKSWWIKQAGEFVLGVLRDDELKVFKKVRRHEADIQQIVDQWQVTLLPLAQALPPQTAPELNWQIIESLEHNDTATNTQDVIDSVAAHPTAGLSRELTSSVLDTHTLVDNESIGEYTELDQSQRFNPVAQSNSTEPAELFAEIHNEETLAELAQLKTDHERVCNESIELQAALSSQKRIQNTLYKSASGWRTFSALLIVGILSLCIGLAHYSHKYPDQLDFLNFVTSANNTNDAAGKPSH